ncbi:MAG TPA: UvrD-helicase domain-containing protein [Candidatus Acidoferrales bacterium]|nr:UvrD-helicase domain-containing protein [Candidatus Acidoferrales bacterium]
MNFLDDLNEQQRQAVETTEGSLLILAGAGTGKTRALTYRIAHLIARGVPGESILAVTFTNKAAEQMKERVTSLLVRAGLPAADPWIGTFHSFCARLLRREAPRIGLSRGFAIYDDEDQIAAIKLVLAKLGRDDRAFPPRWLLGRISAAKNRGESPDALAGEARNEEERVTAQVFDAYQNKLRDSGALDFDDLLLRAVDVLREHATAREQWRKRFAYIHVDEYQDTNRPQYDLLKLLAEPSGNLCVVGDEDQSIYRWRGADVSLILRFAEDFPGAKVVKLEQNYRSTQTILDAASGVVAHNLKRIGKNLVATKNGGSPVKFFEARDATAEAEYAGEAIRTLSREDPSQHVAVFYRTNAQSRAFEEVFRRMGLRYRLIGGFSFYQRAEVKDALAYVRLAMNPNDDVALLRVINTPARGIGKTTMDALRAAAGEHGGSLWSAILRTLETSSSTRALGPLAGFRKLIEHLQEEVASLPPAEFLRHVLDQTGYFEMLQERDTAEDTSRSENLRELVSAVAEGVEAGETFHDFLDRAALVSDADTYDERAPVTLATLHGTKGLEFDHVFLTGLEEGVFPHSRVGNSKEDLEEERRLCYVGMTRAKETLTLTRAVYRRIFGEERVRASTPSRFLQEVPSELVETVPGSLSEAGETRRYEPDPEYSYSPEEFVRRVRRQSFSESSGPRQRRSSGREPRITAGRAGQSDPLIGQRVRHPNYGIGTVIAVEGDAEDRKLTVSFAGYGAKKFIERYAQLTPA